MESRRFHLPDDKEIENLIQCKDAENTKRSTASAVKLFRNFLLETGRENITFEDYEPPEIEKALKEFYTGVRKSDGTTFKESALQSVKYGLKRYLLEKRNIDIFKDDMSGNNETPQTSEDATTEEKSTVTIDEEIETYYLQQNSDNTVRATACALNCFRAFLTESGRKDINFEDYELKDLDIALKDFYVGARKNDGTLFKKTALQNMKYGIKRHMLEKRNIDIISHNAFKHSNVVFKAVLADLKRKGLAKISHYPEISENDIKKLYSGRTAVFDINTPHGLLHKVWFELNYHLCKRGRWKQRAMTKDTFIIKIDEHGRKYVCCTAKNDEEERMYENRGNKNCPVASYEKYLSKICRNRNYLWQRPKDVFSVMEDIWYVSSPIGKNTLGAMMPEISVTGKLSRTYTNHSIRNTTLNLKDVLKGQKPLRRAEVVPADLTEVPSHKDHLDSSHMENIDINSTSSNTNYEMYIWNAEPTDIIRLRTENWFELDESPSLDSTIGPNSEIRMKLDEHLLSDATGVVGLSSENDIKLENEQSFSSIKQEPVDPCPVTDSYEKKTSNESISASQSDISGSDDNSNHTCSKGGNSLIGKHSNENTLSTPPLKVTDMDTKDSEDSSKTFKKTLLIEENSSTVSAQSNQREEDEGNKWKTKCLSNLKRVLHYTINSIVDLGAEVVTMVASPGENNSIVIDSMGSKNGGEFIETLPNFEINFYKFIRNFEQEEPDKTASQETSSSSRNPDITQPAAETIEINQDSTETNHLSVDSQEMKRKLSVRIRDKKIKPVEELESSDEESWSEDEEMDLIEKCLDLIDDEYCKAVQKPYVQFPYKLLKMRGRPWFELIGFPEDLLPFRHPSEYDVESLKRILRIKDKLKFNILHKKLYLNPGPCNKFVKSALQQKIYGLNRNSVHKQGLEDETEKVVKENLPLDFQCNQEVYQTGNSILILPTTVTDIENSGNLVYQYIGKTQNSKSVSIGIPADMAKSLKKQTMTMNNIYYEEPYKIKQEPVEDDFHDISPAKRRKIEPSSTQSQSPLTLFCITSKDCDTSVSEPHKSTLQISKITKCRVENTNSDIIGSVEMTCEQPVESDL